MFYIKTSHQWEHKNRRFVSKKIDFPLISMTDKLISAAEDSKLNRAIYITLKNVIIALEIR